MEGPPLGPGGEDITWPDQVAPRGRKASSTRKIKPQTTSNHTTHHINRRWTGFLTLYQQLEVMFPKARVEFVALCHEA